MKFKIQAQNPSHYFQWTMSRRFSVEGWVQVSLLWRRQTTQSETIRCNNLDLPHQTFPKQTIWTQCCMLTTFWKCLQLGSKWIQAILLTFEAYNKGWYSDCPNNCDNYLNWSHAMSKDKFIDFGLKSSKFPT